MLDIITIGTIVLAVLILVELIISFLPREEKDDSNTLRTIHNILFTTK